MYKRQQRAAAPFTIRWRRHAIGKTKRIQTRYFITTISSQSVDKQHPFLFSLSGKEQQALGEKQITRRDHFWNLLNSGSRESLS